MQVKLNRDYRVFRIGFATVKPGIGPFLAEGNFVVFVGFSPGKRVQRIRGNGWDKRDGDVLKVDMESGKVGLFVIRKLEHHSYDSSKFDAQAVFVGYEGEVDISQYRTGNGNEEERLTNVPEEYVHTLSAWAARGTMMYNGLAGLAHLAMNIGTTVAKMFGKFTTKE